jgi:glycosyltransferase involved in cell wall biosynthesis
MGMSTTNALPTSSPPTPLVSVVVACVNGLPSIDECVAHLLDQEADVPAEIIVVEACGPSVRSALRDKYPDLVLIEADHTRSIPRLRAMGMAAARGQLIAILEDHCNVSRGWMQVIRRAHAAGHQAIGGAVENGSTQRLIDWAVYFCEYARFMLPVAKGIVPEITGNNSVYERAALAKLGLGLQEEVWEAFLHQKLREQGVAFYSDPELVVSHKKEFGFGYFLSQRYHYSRSFSGMRLARAPLLKRLLYAGATSVLLPPLLLWRMARTVQRKGRLGGQFAKSLPVICLFLVPWTWGEVVGALFGPGQSLQKVE